MFDHQLLYSSRELIMSFHVQNHASFYEWPFAKIKTDLHLYFAYKVIALVYIREDLGLIV